MASRSRDEHAEQEPDVVVNPQRSQDPLAGVQVHGGPSWQLAHGAVKVKPSGRTSSDLDRASTHETYDYIDNVSIPIDQVAVPPAPPATDDVSHAVLDEAVTSLTLMRFPLSLGDATAELHALATILAQTQARIPDAVADARDQDHTWNDIAICLAISGPTARRRFAAHARSRKVPLLDD